LCGKCGKTTIRWSTPRQRVCDGCKKARTQLASRGTRLWETYGITEEEHKAIVAFQGGVCAICKGKRAYALDTDHDHALEKAGVPTRQTVRGALCRQCNRRILRSVRDRIDLLEAAIRYLQDPPARHVLSATASSS
jgi:hypothetical protein